MYCLPAGKKKPTNGLLKKTAYQDIC